MSAQPAFNGPWGNGPRPTKEQIDRWTDKNSAKCLEYVKRHAERDEEIRKKKPVVMAELGAYTGYSTVRSSARSRITTRLNTRQYLLLALLYFIDHEKTVYLSDLKLIIGSQTLAPGSVIAADNVVRPGAPDYLEFIENNPQFSTERHTINCGRDGLLLPDLSIATFLG
ncbi:uncharacterized protein PITG_18576 [Phytophthora infestans T30-4]|uniref:Catechol O-methyltransferase n=1 Tax=Phytophthora infestans (strain T30-4) TaxID=403677 RepID=D0NPJ3_PHYIT|nr:uncharacterized protein PITG_14298 [Phytophthora infestans T30-4]XP_002997678.1 uncharacterized protein PITG_18576 [Phytophthora infestans T30-4]EEY62555.1 conserved hypothetical protein [Phytophthora infestans T30-4]EEY68120.1 conserved hypothetical protein [Phytophthora infestans T30-4]KAI9991771.1 hypothetical protein PInf_017132 [Phytophthora infestans]|eukprot:XP_002898797.1 conserved hypothetical protein [Phytophthora infestans T30-4]